MFFTKNGKSVEDLYPFMKKLPNNSILIKAALADKAGSPYAIDFIAKDPYGS